MGELGETGTLDAAACGVCPPRRGLPETAEEIVELCRAEMQAIIERTDWSRKGEELMDSPGVPHQWVRIIAADLTEVGHFMVDLPPEATRQYSRVMALSLRRHWVYKQREDLGIDLVFTRGKVYPVLHQLESEGFLSSRRSEPLPERGNRPRKYYRLTDKGRRQAVDASKLDGKDTNLIPKPILLADLSSVWTDTAPCVADLILDLEA